MKLPISVCILALNEESLIEDAVLSVVNIVNEVLVLDTGSTDQTVKRAKEAGAEVYSFTWLNNFAMARNQMIKLAKNLTIFMMDADERYIGDGSDLKEYIDSNISLAASIRIINKLDQHEFTETNITRIFPKQPQYQYEGIIHEQLKKGGESVSGIRTDITLLHYGYHKEEIDKKDKINRNLNLLKDQLNDSPEDPYTLYQIGKTYYVNKSYPEAIINFQYALKIIESAEYNFKPNLYLYYAYSLMYQKMWDEAKIILITSIDKYPDFTDLYFMHASLIIESRNINDFHLVPVLYEKCLTIGEANPTKYETAKGIGSYKALYNLGIYHELMGHIHEAMKFYRESSEYNYTPAQERLHLLIKS